LAVKDFTIVFPKANQRACFPFCAVLEKEAGVQQIKLGPAVVGFSRKKQFESCVHLLSTLYSVADHCGAATVLQGFGKVYTEAKGVCSVFRQLCTDVTQLQCARVL